MASIFREFKYHIFIITITLFITLLIVPIATRVRVEENGHYYTKEKVSLYILKYKELPGNFITKSEATTLYATYYDAMEEGFAIGGDIFIYDGTITSLTDITTLRECDIYLDRQKQIADSNRGVDRLVFALDGSEVFYTHDHYSTFEEVTVFSIQSTSTAWWVVFVVYNSGIATLYVYTFKSKWITKQDVLVSGKKTLTFMNGFVLLLVSLAVMLIKKLSIKLKISRNEVLPTDTKDE
ncbi:MAG: hypothetical protein JW708_01115 [Vallitaleaceae bacterium]|nr:hypothetical protein [Vallitaleaceae bacterium]MBN2696228.1 hypothetical protein [Bacilli bacterium]